MKILVLIPAFLCVIACSTPPQRQPATTGSAARTVLSAPGDCARQYAVAYDDVTTATRALIEAPRYKNTLVVTQLKPIQDTITARLGPKQIDSAETCRAIAGELRLNVLDLRQALIELANVPRRDGRGPLVQNATITAIMYARVSDRLRKIIY